METSNIIVGIGAYTMFVFFMWFVLTVWIHDVKKLSWNFSIAIGAFAAIFWPVSIMFVYFYEQMHRKDGDDGW